MKIRLTLLLLTLFTALNAAVQTADVDAFIKEVSADSDLDAHWVREVLQQAKHQPGIIEAMNKPAERTLNWTQYRNIFVQPERVEAGIKFWQEHAQALNEVSSATGVPAEYIVAIIGVETYYGRIMGKHRVLDALYTLAFDYPKRGAFFRKELKNFLLLSQEAGIDITSVLGSYAGAMGYGQFMPSSYRAYARDYDQDAVIDLLANPRDAIASVANYFKAHKWQSGEPVAAAVDNPVVPTDYKFNLLEPNLAASQFKSLSDDQRKKQVTVLSLDRGEGQAPEHWVGFDNFYVITRYNRSHMYALVVHQMATALKAAHEKM